MYFHTLAVSTVLTFSLCCISMIAFMIDFIMFHDAFNDAFHDALFFISSIISYYCEIDLKATVLLPQP